MSAETLRRAAALMRDRAEAATPGPWELDSNDCCVGASDLQGDDYWVAGERTGAPVANLRHIASWHPAVALAVADWLDSLAREVEARLAYTKHPDPEPKTFHALAVARAYLGESA